MTDRKGASRRGEGHAVDRGSRTTFPIGVDLGSRCIKIVQLRRDPDGTLGLAARIRELPDGLGRRWQSHLDDAVALIRPMLRSGGFTGRRAVASITDDIVQYRNMRLAPMAAEDLKSAVHAKFGDHLGLPDDQYQTQFLDAGEVWDGDEARREIIAMAAPLTGVNALIRLLGRCGLLAMAIDAAPTATARSLAPLGAGDGDGSRLFLDIGYAATLLLIVDRESIRFMRRFEFGVGTLDADLAEKLKVSREQAEAVQRALREGDADAGAGSAELPLEGAGEAVRSAASVRGARLAAEIGRCLRYYCVTFRAARPDAGLVIGGGAETRALVEPIRAGTGVALRTVGAADGPEWMHVAGDRFGNVPVGIWSVAAGLSMYGPDHVGERAAA